MKVISVISYILGVAVGLFLVVIPTIATWGALWDSVVAGILFTFFIFPIAILGYPIVILVAGLATGIGGTESVLAAVLAYIMIAISMALFILGGWLWDKGEERAYAGQRQFYYSDSQELPESNYMGNRNTLVFHSIYCNHASMINYESSIRFETPEQAISQGFKPCKSCIAEGLLE